MVIDVPVVLSGYGPVGRAYATELAERGTELAAAYGVRPHVVAVRGATGEYRTEPGVAGAGAVVPGRAEWGVVSGFEGLLDEVRPVVFAQAVPSSAEVAPVAAAEALAALRRGVHVVTATKGHLLSDWRALRDAARGGDAELRFSGATGAALPAGDVARDSLLGFGCRAIRACPNGTSTYVLDLMAGGATLDEALADARRRGIAEADPIADLSGADAAAKVRLLTGLAWDWDVTATAVRLTPIDAATATVARAAAADGHRLRAVATARADRPGEVTVDLAPTAPGDPLYTITGPGKAVVFDCGDAGEITVSGGRSSPRGAALAMLKDTLAVAAAR
jgi:homoserine dehydrogenase